MTYFGKRNVGRQPRIGTRAGLTIQFAPQSAAILTPLKASARESRRFQKPRVLMCAAFETTTRGRSDGPTRAAIETYHSVAEGN